ncbi:MAG: hypothetical protein ACE5HX_15705 [bacterium]
MSGENNYLTAKGEAESKEVVSERILALWDSWSAEMEYLYDHLLEGKSELAAVKLSGCLYRHSGESRNVLVELLKRNEI